MASQFQVGSLADFISQKAEGKTEKKPVQKNQNLLDKLFAGSSDTKAAVVHVKVDIPAEEKKPVKKNKRTNDDYAITAVPKAKKYKQGEEPDEDDVENVLDPGPAAFDDGEDDEADFRSEKVNRSLKKQELKNIKKKENSKGEKPEDSDRVILIKNLPSNVKRRTIQRFFGKVGTIDAVWLRCAALADPAVPKKVAVIKKDFHPERKSISAFVRYEKPESAQEALSLTGTEFQDHHITVTLSTEKKETNKAIFVGNLSFSIEDEDLWQHFAECGKIVDVRIVRDRTNGIGKGFGYVNFESTDSVELALKLDQSTLRDRAIRVTRCKRNPKPHNPDTTQDKNTGAYRRVQGKQVKQGPKQTSGWMAKLKQRKKTAETGQALPSFAGDVAGQKDKPVKKAKVLKKNKDEVRKASIAAKLAATKAKPGNKPVVKKSNKITQPKKVVKTKKPLKKTKAAK